MRHIVHPGSVSPGRWSAIACRAVPLSLRLETSRSVNDSVGEAFAAAGFASGYARLSGAKIDPMRYVMPAAAPNREHAAWYSETFAPDGISTVEDAGLIVGRRDGAPFLHCHGIWDAGESTRRMGHLLPLEAQFCAPAEAIGFGLVGAGFDVHDDPETNFRLFRAVPDKSLSEAGSRAIACTIKPNEDIHAAIEAICGEHDIRDATIHGIGSLVGADFEDGSHMSSYATEVLVRSGTVEAGICSLDIAMVGMTPPIAQDRLHRGGNPVCVTFELVIVDARG